MDKLIEGAQVELVSDESIFEAGDRGYVERDEECDHVSIVVEGFHVNVPRASLKEIGLEHEVARDMAEAGDIVEQLRRSGRCSSL